MRKLSTAQAPKENWNLTATPVPTLVMKRGQTWTNQNRPQNMGLSLSPQVELPLCDIASEPPLLCALAKQNTLVCHSVD